MAKGFGQLFKLRNIVYYRLSPHELKVFGGVITTGIPNSIRRIASEILYVVPPLAIGYVIYDQVEKKHEQLSRKNPADYENDQ